MLKELMIRSTLIALLYSVSFAAHAVADAPKDVNVPAGNLVPALEALAKQEAVELLYQPEQLKSFHTQGVKGSYTAQDAVRLLLKGTPLELRTDPSGAMVISVPGARPLSQSPGPDGTQEGKKSSSDGFRVAQVDQGQTSSPSTVEGQDERAFKEKVVSSEGAISEILIKGSRIMNVDVKRTQDDVQPYYILDSQMIEQSGATNVEDVLKQRLTMNTTFNTNSQTYGSQYGATSSVNLRGLGTNETLILVDGRRSAGVNLSFNTTTGQPDINSIPLAAVERIEVLPSSASAIYGGAAIGGVVNVVLKKNFEGGEVNAIYDNTASANAPLRTLNATYGWSLEDGKTRIMLAGNYSDAQALLLQDRLDLVGRGVATILSNSPSYFYTSTTPFPGATPNIASANGSNLVLKNGTPLNSPITFVPAGTTPGSSISAGLVADAGTYNLNLGPGTGEYGLQNAIGVAPLRKSLTATIRREFTSSIEVFAEFSTLSNWSNQLHNSFGRSWTIPSSAPDNPFNQNVLVTFPSASSTSLTADSVTQSATEGLLAHLGGDWSSELDYTWSRNSFEYNQAGYDGVAFPAALASGTVNPFVDTIAHPLNLTPYIGTQSAFSGDSTLDDLGLRASGPVGSLPWGRPTLTVGLEHRKEGTHDGSQYSSFPLDPSNVFAARYFGQSQSTNSVYAEALVPLVAATNAVPFIHSLDLQLAGRSEKYTVYAGTPFEYLLPAFLQPFSPPQGLHTTIRYTSTNPTVGLKYQPVQDVIMRVSYARAFLPPTAAQFMPNPAPACGFPCFPITDPRNGQTYNVDFTSGGNPNLKPQTSRDWDLGVIWEPQEQVLKGLRVDLEYYKVTQPNYITTPGLQLLVSNPAYASRVTRDPTTGLITLVDDSPLNATEYKSSGWDLTLDYRKPTAFGTFDLHALGTVIEHDLRQYTIGGPFLEFVGYPSELGEAKARANATLSWEYRRWTLGWTTTYVGPYLQAGSPADPIALQFPGLYSNIFAAQGRDAIPLQVYHDIFARYVFDETAAPSSRIAHNLLSNLSIQIGIKNLFNSSPPFDAFLAPYFYSPYGDPRLRSYRISLHKGF